MFVCAWQGFPSRRGPCELCRGDRLTKASCWGSFGAHFMFGVSNIRRCLHIATPKPRWASRTWKNEWVGHGIFDQLHWL
jgi:hypothetical protein